MRPQEPPQIAERRVTFADLRVTQPSLQRSYLVPSYTTAKDGEAEALDVLAHILGGGSNSRLYRALVMEKRVATSAGAWYQGTSLDATRFGVYATAARRRRRSNKLEGAIDAVIATLLDKGVDGRGAGARQEPHDRRLRLRAGQPGDARAHVRRGADHRLDRRGRAGAARSGCAP